MKFYEGVCSGRVSRTSDELFFDLKWKNRDANVVEQANIPKFSKLDDIGIPFIRLFKLFFDDALVDMIVGNTKSYGHREKGDTTFEITDETFRLFSGMLLLSGCHNLSDRRMYWETTPDTSLQIMSDSIPRNTLSVFFKIFIFKTTNN